MNADEIIDNGEHSPRSTVPSEPKFKVGDVVTFLGFSVLGAVVDPDGVDAQVLWMSALDEAAVARFKVGEVYEGISEEDLYLTPDDVKRGLLYGEKPDEALKRVASEIGGGLSGGLIYEEPETFSLAQMMGAVITEALGENPTPESCEDALALTVAARDFLTAMRVRRFAPSPAAENLKRLAEEMGIVREDEDGPP